MNKFTYERAIAGTFGIGLVLLVLITGLIIVAPITVLQGWHIQTDKTSYGVGDTIILQSSSVKLRKAQGAVSRTIECDTGKDATVGYNLNLSTAERPPGPTTSLYGLKIPSNIVQLPATCRVVISVEYKVYLFRHITQSTVSNDFHVVE